MFRLALPAVVLFALPFATAADSKTIDAFNGKNLDGWKVRDEKKSKWQVCAVSIDEKNPTKLIAGINNSPDGKGSALATIIPGCDIYTAEKYGNVLVEVEFMIPKGSNSGIYLCGEYEVQVLDSFGKPNDQLKPGDMGGIYNTAAPKTNACKKPGEWQKIVIDFQAPKFEGDKKVTNGQFLKVTLNDVVIHENVEVKGSTGSGLTGKDVATGPLLFQGDHGPVAFRSVKITPR